MTEAPDPGGPPRERAVLRVLSGNATPEEIAAVVAAVVASSTSTTSTGTTSTGDSPPASIWSGPGYAHRNVRATFTPGPNGWRTSFWPR